MLVYHFMWLADEHQGCPSCSFLVDNVGDLSHLHARHTTLALVSRGPLDEILGYRDRMGSTVPWYSSLGSMFNYDFHVTIDPDVAPVEYNYKDLAQLEAENVAWRDWSGEQPGTSAFLRHGDRVFHTYSSYGRGGDLLIGTYNWLDLTGAGVRRTSRNRPDAATARSWSGSSATTSTRRTFADVREPTPERAEELLGAARNSGSFTDFPVTSCVSWGSRNGPIVRHTSLSTSCAASRSSGRLPARCSSRTASTQSS